MQPLDPLDPYSGNVLTSGLGSILSPEQALQWLTELPPLPGELDGVPRHIRLHRLLSIRDFHLPPLIERQLQQTIDLMTRRSYHYRDPSLSSTWGVISGEAQRRKRPGVPGFAAAVEGISGVGKTEACLRCLNCYPNQALFHETFPRISGPLHQIVWLSVNIPASGKMADLAHALMVAWVRVTGSKRFDHLLEKESIRDGARALEEWRQVAASHFLGVLHLDEVQNFFRLGSLKQRTSRQGAREAPQLSIVEDQCLRWVLNLADTGQVPLLFSGTPDGIGALTRRLSTLERVNNMGYHPFDPFVDPAGPAFRAIFLRQLGRYQYVKRQLPVDDALARLIVDLTGGIQRLIIALWIAAHRVAFEREEDDLRLEDFTVAARTWLAPLAPAVAAIRRKDANAMSHYEDLVKRDTSFWAKFWQKAAAT